MLVYPNYAKNYASTIEKVWGGGGVIITVEISVAHNLPHSDLINSY